MNSQKQVEILHFSDILCIWAYIAQIRTDELKIRFGTRIDLKFHFMTIFGSAHQKITSGWEHRGGFEGYSRHIKQVVDGFEHVKVHPLIWTKNIPHSSISCHLFLKAVQLLQQKNDIPNKPGTETPCEQAVKALRRAFFENLINISEQQAQIEIAEQLQFPVGKILNLLTSGEAFAALDQDRLLADEFQVRGSPTLILNEGRQKIYGNVGYSVIEANVLELLSHSGSQATWC